jgi:hypothetical protein
LRRVARSPTPVISGCWITDISLPANAVQRPDVPQADRLLSIARDTAPAPACRYMIACAQCGRGRDGAASPTATRWPDGRKRHPCRCGSGARVPPHQHPRFCRAVSGGHDVAREGGDHGCIVVGARGVKVVDVAYQRGIAAIAMPSCAGSNSPPIKTTRWPRRSRRSMACPWMPNLRNQTDAHVRWPLPDLEPVL